MVGTPPRLVYYTLLKVAVTERASRTPAGRDAGRRASWPLRMSDGFNPRDTDSSGLLDVIRGQHVRVAFGRCVAAVRTCAVTPWDKIGSAACMVVRTAPQCHSQGSGVRAFVSTVIRRLAWRSVWGGMGLLASCAAAASGTHYCRAYALPPTSVAFGQVARRRDSSPGVPENEGSHHELGRCCSALTRETSGEPHAHARGERAASEKPSGKSNRPPDLPYPFSWL